MKTKRHLGPVTCVSYNLENIRSKAFMFGTKYRGYNCDIERHEKIYSAGSEDEERVLYRLVK
jgi:hypothetical protein